MVVTPTMDNPFREGLPRERKPDPAILVIFGGSGDLARRKLMPSLYELEKRGALPDETVILGFAFTKRTREEFQKHVHDALREYMPGGLDEEAWRRFSVRLRYIASSFDDDNGYIELSRMITDLDAECHTNGNVLFHLASPPSLFIDIIKRVQAAGLLGTLPGWKRIMIEKPFGRDLESARNLNEVVCSVFGDENVYRVDHYLGKETVQNIAVFRFANLIFEPVWNRMYVDHVQITSSEDLGIEGRAEYYEQAGALRDMIQSHGLQLISLVAMEPPSAYESGAILDEKVKVLNSIRRIRQEDVDLYTVRGQYGPGLMDGKSVPGYREEPDVSPTSSVETYIACKFYIDNARWRDVPFYIRSGKRLSRKRSEIAIQFKQLPHDIFGITSPSHSSQNSLILRTYPDEGAALRLQTKPPGASSVPRPVELDFHYLNAFGALPSEDYEQLFLDCMLGDQTLFAGRETVEAQWSVVTPILQGWEMSKPPEFPNYQAGTWGPQAADDLIAKDGRRWRTL